jgi:hypothetical protein
MEKPNPSDPTMVDVYDDQTGEYVTTLPAVSDPMTGQMQPPVETPPATGQDAVSRGVRSVGKALEVAPMANAGLPQERQGTTELDNSFRLNPGASDEAGAEQVEGLIDLQPGAADGMPAEIPGTPGGMEVKQEQSTGLNPERAADLIGQTNDAAEQDRAGVLDEALARETQLMEDEKRHASLVDEVKQAQAKNAIEMKQMMDRRRKVEDRYSAVANQEPDRGRSFPTGWSLVATYIGGIAAGMLQGLNGGRNQVLDSLMQRLDDDVKQQRITQSEQLKDLTRQLGSVDAAEDMLRAKQKEVVLKETEARLLGTANKVAPAQIDAFRKRMNAEITRHKVDAISKLDRDLTIQEVNTPGTSAQPFNAESFRAEQLQQYAAQNGLKPKDAHAQWNTWSKGFKDRATLRSGLDTANRLLQKYEETNDVAGLGPMAKFIPNSVNTKDAVAVRQVLGNVTAQYLKAISGAAVTEQEYGRTIDNLQGAGDFDSVKRGLALIGTSVKSADEEDQIQNPTFWRMRGQIQQLSRGGDVTKQEGRGQQEGQVGEVVRIPSSSRIAYEHNNPGNLTFAGQRGATRGEARPKGGYWARFENTNDGMRALARQVQIDQERGMNVRQFVEKYAPKTDKNDVEAYLQKIQRLTGADEATNLSELSAGRLAFVLAGIESGARPTR